MANGVSPEPYLLTVLGAVAGNSLQSLTLHFDNNDSAQPLLSNFDCWRDFVQNCDKLTTIVLDSARMTADAFGQLGRLQSLQKCSFKSYFHPLSADYLHRLVDVRGSFTISDFKR